MKLSTYLIISSIVSLIYAVSLLFFPAQFIGKYGITIDAGATLITRLLGSVMLGNAIFYWLVRNLPPSNVAVKSLLWSGLLFNVVNTLIVVMAINYGIGNSMNWFTVGVSLLFALGSLYFVTRKQ